MINEQAAKPLFYVHLPSCGGSTFWSILRSVYGRQNVVRCVANKEKEGNFFSIDNVQAKFADKMAIGGHIHYSMAHERCPDRQLITLLRHPVDRLISMYYRKIRNEKWKPSLKRGKYDILRFCKIRRLHLPKYFVSSGSDLISRNNNNDSFIAGKAEEIMNVLKNQFAGFGILEHYNRSLFLFRDLLGWETVPTYDQTNIGGNRPKAVEQDVREQLEELLKVDCRIYRFALRLFEERWAETSSASRTTELAEYETAIEERRLHLLQTNDGKNPHVKL